MGTPKAVDVRTFMKSGCALPRKVTPEQAVSLVSIKPNPPCGPLCGCWDILLIVLKAERCIIIIEYFSAQSFIHDIKV